MEMVSPFLFFVLFAGLHWFSLVLVVKFQWPNFYLIFSGLEEPKPYDIVAADPGYVRSPISLLFWHIFCFGTSEEMRHHQR